MHINIINNRVSSRWHWLRTNGVDTNGAAAKVMNFDRLEEGTPWHFWEDKSRLTGVPKKSLSKKLYIFSDPISADPICHLSLSEQSKDTRRMRESGVSQQTHIVTGLMGT